MVVLGSQRARIENKGKFVLIVRKWLKIAVFGGIYSLRSPYGLFRFAQRCLRSTSAEPGGLIHPSSPPIAKTADKRRFSHWSEWMRKLRAINL